jgi:hypothetical protein
MNDPSPARHSGLTRKKGEKVMQREKQAGGTNTQMCQFRKNFPATPPQRTNTAFLSRHQHNFR